MRAKNLIMPAKKAAAKKAATKVPAARKRVAPKTASAATKKASAPAAKTRAAKRAAAKVTEPEIPPAPLSATTLPQSEGEALAIAAARAAEDIKAENILVLDVSGVSSITDFFVLCSGSSTPHLKAIARDIRAQLAESHHVKPHKPDGETESHWVVLDYGIVIVHIFHPEKRELYALEDLWGDARKVEWKA